MPELPEVETVRRQLKQKVIGKVIDDILVKKPKLFRGKQKDVEGAKIISVNRRGKNIVIDLSNKLHLIVHLKMTGQLIYVDCCGKYGGGHPIPPFDTEVPNKYSHVHIKFKDGSVLYFNDLRQFGWIKVADDKQLKREFGKLGPEPLDKSFTLEKFKKILKSKPKGKIKPTLMDQSLIAGIGNIYASEICFDAGVMPRRRIASLKKKEIEKLYKAIKKIMPVAIKYQGTSANNYVTLTGDPGKYEKYLKVYGKEGEKCPGCNGKIKKVKMAQRGTYYCPSCQK